MAPTEAAHVLAPHVRLLLLILAVIRDQLPTARQMNNAACQLDGMSWPLKRPPASGSSDG
jgi:hypothetical protein